MPNPREKSCKRRQRLFERLEPRQMLSGDGVWDLAKFQRTTADSTSNSLASEATDGLVSNDSAWVSASGGGGHWLEVELTAPYDVGSAQLFLGEDDSSTVASFEIQYHDGASWQTITSVSGNVATDLNLVFPETIEDATRYRFYTDENVARVKEFVLLSPTSDPEGHALGAGVDLNLAAQRAPLASSKLGDDYAILTVDGYLGDDSAWNPSTVSGSHQIEFPLASTHEVGSLHVYTGNPDAANPSPTETFGVEYWDGSAWNSITTATVSSGSFRSGTVRANTSTELEIVFADPVDTDNLRLTFTDVAPNLREVVVLPANVTDTGAVGYPIGVSTQEGDAPTTQFAEYGDDWYRLVSSTNNDALVSDSTGSLLAGRSSVDVVAEQYQLLYSYALDAYRLLNRDSGLTLEVEGASLEAGAAIVEGDYSAAPHQLWRLESLGGDARQIVNAWSGLAIEIGDEFPFQATQQPLDESADPTTRQQWRVEFSEDYFKKGSGGWVGQHGTSWGYNWARGDFENPNPEFFYAPMQHREGWPNLGTLHRRYADWNNDVWPLYLLGFNEPDRPDQADMTVNRGVELWPRLTAMDVPLVSPAPALGGEDWWLTPWMDQVDNLGYRTDYVGGHWYAGPSVDSLMSHINDLQNDGNGRDVWLTEFSVVDWSGGSGDWSEESNYNFILNFLWRAETKNNLDKYAIFIFSGGSPTNPWDMSNPRSNFFSGGSLTPFGKAYAAWDGETTIYDNRSYILHNRNARHRLDNNGGDAPDATWIRDEDAGVQWALQDAGDGKKHIVSNVDGRLLRYDGQTLDFAPVGATGADVEWTIQREQHGWHNIVHADTGEYLRLIRQNNSNNAPVSLEYEMVSASAASGMGSTDWHFVRPWNEVLPFDDTPPEIASASFNATTDQSVSVVFSEAINSTSIGSDDFTITHLETGAQLFNRDIAVGEVTPERMTIDVLRPPLADGNYRLAFEAGGFIDLSGNRNLEYEMTFQVLAGDANGDAVVDGSDYGIWEASYGSTSDLASDWNRNGVVDILDYTLWRQNEGVELQDPGATVPGDANADSVVDDTDYLIWSQTHGSTAGSAADWNGNGVVDAVDFAIWREHEQSQDPGTSAPGDANSDSVADDEDYGIWAETFGSTSDLAADWSGNGLVDALDFTIWREHETTSSAAFSQLFGQSGAPSAVSADAPADQEAVGVVPRYHRRDLLQIAALDEVFAREDRDRYDQGDDSPDESLQATRVRNPDSVEEAAMALRRWRA